MKTLEVGKRIALTNILFATDFSPYSNAALPYVWRSPVNTGRSYTVSTSCLPKVTLSLRRMPGRVMFGGKKNCSTKLQRRLKNRSSSSA
jgi:hypothetical protein